MKLFHTAAAALLCASASNLAAAESEWGQGALAYLFSSEAAVKASEGYLPFSQLTEMEGISFDTLLLVPEKLRKISGKCSWVRSSQPVGDSSESGAFAFESGVIASSDTLTALKFGVKSTTVRSAAVTYDSEGWVKSSYLKTALSSKESEVEYTYTYQPAGKISEIVKYSIANGAKQGEERITFTRGQDGVLVRALQEKYSGGKWIASDSVKYTAENGRYTKIASVGKTLICKYSNSQLTRIDMKDSADQWGSYDFTYLAGNAFPAKINAYSGSLTNGTADTSINSILNYTFDSNSRFTAGSGSVTFKGSGGGTVDMKVQYDGAGNLSSYEEKSKFSLGGLFNADNLEKSDYLYSAGLPISLKSTESSVSEMETTSRVKTTAVSWNGTPISAGPSVQNRITLSSEGAKVHLSLPVQNASAQLFTLNGRTAAQLSPSKQGEMTLFTVDPQKLGLASGVYFVRVQAENAVQTIKIQL